MTSGRILKATLSWTQKSRCKNFRLC